MDAEYFFDTWALFEILNKNAKYKKYIQSKIIISEFIFAEFCFKILTEDIEDAEWMIKDLAPAIVRPDADTIKEAMAFMIKNKKRKLTMTDCVSYIMAERLNAKFLTGDAKFKGLDGVEFVN